MKRLLWNWRYKALHVSIIGNVDCITAFFKGGMKMEEELLEKNRKAFDDYNKMVNEHGLYGDDRRLF
jgi:hypothetical protein